LKTIKTKTQPYKAEHCTYYLVSRKSNLNKKGITRKRGEQLILRTRDSYKSTYPEFPNGKYYVYQIHIDSFMKGDHARNIIFTTQNKTINIFLVLKFLKVVILNTLASIQVELFM